MNDVDFTRHLPNPTGDDVIVQSASTHRSDDLIRDSQLPPGQRGSYLYSFRDRAMQHAWQDEQIGSGGRQTIHLLPGCIADPIGAELVRKAVEDADLFFMVVHFDCFLT